MMLGRRIAPFSARIGLVLALAAALSACDEATDGAAQAQGAQQAPAEVTVAVPLVKRLTEWDEFTGRFEAVQRVEIRARVSGYLDRIGFKDGDIVEAGQLLFVIDPRPYEAARDQIRAQIASAEARQKLAQLEQGRTEQLVSTSAQARARLDQRNAELQEAEGTLAAARAQLRDAELDVGFTQVRAPFRGRISDRRVDVGNLVDEQLLLTTIVQLDPIYLVFDMSEADFLGYQRAVLSGDLPSTRDRQTIVAVNLVDEEEAWRRQGTMDFVDNVVDQGTGTVRGRAVFANPDNLITPGQFGRIRIPGSPEYDAILVPEAAIVTDQSRKQLMVLGPENKIEPREIRPGPSQPGSLRIVRRGIKAEERFVIGGLLKARPGSVVTPKEGKVEAEPLPPPAS